MQPKVLRRWLECIATGEPFDMEFPIKGKDGVFRPFLTRAEPVRDDGGRIVGWFGTDTDIGERQRAEEGLWEADRRKDEFLATLAPDPQRPARCLPALGDPEAHEQARSMMERQLRPDGAAGRRPARREPHHHRQAGDSARSGSTGGGRRACGRDEPPPDRPHGSRSSP